MWKKLVDYYKIPESASEPSTDNARFKRIRLISFLTATLGYGMYYVCRLSMNVIRKPMVEDGILQRRKSVSLALVCFSPMLSVSSAMALLRIEAM